MAPNPEFMPLHNICEWLNALHVYAEEARRGETRSVEAHHYCSHVRKGTLPNEEPKPSTVTNARRFVDLRQCLIYDSGHQDARLIGVEYMVPKHVYKQLDSDEQKLWHSHEFEVSSGMLAVQKPAEHSEDQWEQMETEAMKEVAGLYGKTWHFWQVDRGDELPLGYPTLMGSLTSHDQLPSLKEAITPRDKEYGVDHERKAEIRANADVQGPGVHENADLWWKEAEEEKSTSMIQKATDIIRSRS